MFAYKQAKGFNRTIFVRLPREEQDLLGLWLLISAAYGLNKLRRLLCFT